MSTSVSSLSNNFFPSAENGFTTTTSGSVSSGAATVGLNSVAGYTNGEVAVFVIDPTDVSKKQTFTGVIDTAGVQVTDVVWTAGTNQSHALGATVVDYATATHISMITKGLIQEHNQDGTHGAVTATSLVTTQDVTVGDDLTVTGDVAVTGPTVLTGALTIKSYDGWITATDTWTYASATTFTISGVDRTAQFPVGTKLKLTQTTAKYFYVVSSSFSTNTTVTVTGGSDYSLANAAITSPLYSYMNTPQGFPGVFNYTPTWTNLTVSSSTVVAAFSMLGRIVHFRVRVTLAGGNVPTGNVSLTPPVTVNTGYAGSSEKGLIGYCKVLDAGVASYVGSVQVVTGGSNIQPNVHVSSGTYTTQTGITATVPFTFGNTDEIFLTGTYEAA